MQTKRCRAPRFGATATALVAHAAAVAVAGALAGASSVAVHAQIVAPERPDLSTDLLAGSNDNWTSPDWSRWEFNQGAVKGETLKFPEVATGDAEAAAYLLTRNVIEGDLELSMDIVFQRSRYIGVYLDYDPDTDTGMWLATGHPLPEDDAGESQTETAYIKTVDNGDWVVRARGELTISPGEVIRLRWVKSGPDYSIWQDDRLVVVYRPERNYEPGPVMLRLMSAVAEIRRLEMRSDRVR